MEELGIIKVSRKHLIGVLVTNIFLWVILLIIVKNWFLLVPASVNIITIMSLFSPVKGQNSGK